MNQQAMTMEAIASTIASYQVLLEKAYRASGAEFTMVIQNLVLDFQQKILAANAHILQLEIVDVGPQAKASS